MDTPEIQLELAAPAKINLILKIHGKRDDGYHDLTSLMQKISLTDRLFFCRRQSAGITLRCPESNLPENHTNIAFKAASSYRDYVDLQTGIEIVLHKNIPVAAGLGGGSSDAAAVLIGLDKLFGSSLSQDELLQLAAPLGADVPFFVLQHGAAIATGTGTQLEPCASIHDYWIVLVNPGIAVSTKWVFDNFALTTESNQYIFSGYSKSFDYIHEAITAFKKRSSKVGLCNDLESVTARKHKVIQDIKYAFENGGAVSSLMSGSGPTVFGIFDDLGKATMQFEVFKNKFPNTFLTEPL